MEKLFVTDEAWAEHKTRCLPVPKGESVKYSLARKDPTYFVVNQLGIRPYTWQTMLLDNLCMRKNTLACTSRQVGKTAALAWFALWACCHNTMPILSTKKTRIIFVSKTEGQAMKVIADVREFMRMGDDRVYELTKGKVQKFFTNKIAKGENVANTKSVISFTNGCQIISLPPTDAARGYTASQLFIDEVAFIPNDIINEVLIPIVAATGNKISATSTPNGKQGWFFSNFDPDGKLDEHNYERIWCPYTGIRHEDPTRVEFYDKEKQHRMRLGEERSFLQEYEADFTASASSFFLAEDIDNSIDGTLDNLRRYPGECDMGIDFGKKVSRTVISITTLETPKDKESRIRLLYQYEYGEEKGVGQDLVEDVEEFLKQYNIQRIIVEDCPQSAFFQYACKEKAWNMTVFNPTADKNKQYNLLKSWMRQGRVRMPDLPELSMQMRGLVVVALPTRDRIEHGAGLRDDCIDSLMISTYHMTVEQKKLRVFHTPKKQRRLKLV